MKLQRRVEKGRLKGAVGGADRQITSLNFQGSTPCELSISGVVVAQYSSHNLSLSVDLSEDFSWIGLEFAFF
jgi:hypothetical protein